jgi:hypothetical protein
MNYARAERIAIMMESGVTEQEAEEYCNRYPEIFGLKVKEQVQAVLELPVKRR